MKMFINHGIHRIYGMMVSIAVLFGFVGSAYAGAVEATSPVFGLSVKHDGVRVSAGAETLTYSSQWDGGDGATVTIAENGVVLADGLSGEGTRPWSVQKTGEYTLTHTTYTNGIAGKVETAMFVVPGPELTFEYDGGPFVGGKVTINGNIDGWTIYYTLDGSTPTTESLKYTGPFTLSSAANLKAYAVSDSGMSTPLIENNYAVVECARIENVRARQRWPWNGKVDIDFNVVGSVGVSYGVVLSVTDTIGGTNLMMRTVTTSEGAAINPTGAKVIPGQYRWIWDAAADLPDGFECAAISVNVDVLGDGAFAYFVRFNANGGEGIMDDEMFIYGVEKALPANAFKRGGYAFAGWSTSPEGEKVYDDKQQILNVSILSGTVINLYATWKEEREKVQLWEGGPYWATTNIGAEKPEDYGYYFWWGDTVGYKRENDKWVASDGSNSDFSFPDRNMPTDNKSISILQSEGWITADGVLAPEHDAANIHWGNGWRMPTKDELSALTNNCDWTWTTMNGVNGYVVRGRGAYASNSIFLPAAGCGVWDLFNNAGSYGNYWSSVPYGYFLNVAFYACDLSFYSSYHGTKYGYNGTGYSVRPVMGGAPQTPQTYAVIFDANGGEGGSTLLCDYGSTLGELSIPTREGYTFAGWWTDTEGGTQVDASTIVTGNVTYYAHWEEIVKDSHESVQLWEGGPYWATTNVGAEKPEDSGYYFWWGDTVGYKRENGKWVVSDGSGVDFLFTGGYTPTFNKSIATLQSEGWITSEGVLASEYDAAKKHWGGDWRMPTKQEFDDLNNKCDWTWTTFNGVNGYIVRGKGDYASNSIFLPCAGFGYMSSLDDAGSYGGYWSSVPSSDYYNAWPLTFGSSYRFTDDCSRGYGLSVRPLQGFTK